MSQLSEQQELLERDVAAASATGILASQNSLEHKLDQQVVDRSVQDAGLKIESAKGVELYRRVLRYAAEGRRGFDGQFVLEAGEMIRQAPIDATLKPMAKLLGWMADGSLAKAEAESSLRVVSGTGNTRWLYQLEAAYDYRAQGHLDSAEVTTLEGALARTFRKTVEDTLATAAERANPSGTPAKLSAQAKMVSTVTKHPLRAAVVSAVTIISGFAGMNALRGDDATAASPGRTDSTSQNLRKLLPEAAGIKVGDVDATALLERMDYRPNSPLKGERVNESATKYSLETLSKWVQENRLARYYVSADDVRVDNKGDMSLRPGAMGTIQPRAGVQLAVHSVQDLSGGAFYLDTRAVVGAPERLGGRVYDEFAREGDLTRALGAVVHRVEGSADTVNSAGDAHRGMYLGSVDFQVQFGAYGASSEFLYELPMDHVYDGSVAEMQKNGELREQPSQSRSAGRTQAQPMAAGEPVPPAEKPQVTTVRLGQARG